jgi:hypothetical protein
VFVPKLYRLGRALWQSRLYSLQNLHASSLFKVENPKKLLKLVMEKLNPQYQLRFKDSRFRNIIELKDAIVEFDQERKEINTSKRIQSQVNSIKESFESDFSSPGSSGQQSEGTGQDDAVPAWARKLFTLSDGRRQWDNTTNPNLAKKAVAAYNSGKRDSGPYKGQPQQKETRSCYFCGKLGHIKANCYKWKRVNGQNQSSNFQPMGRPRFEKQDRSQPIKAIEGGPGTDTEQMGKGKGQ